MKSINVALGSATVGILAGIVICSGQMKDEFAQFVGIVGLAALPASFITYLIVDTKAQKRIDESEKYYQSSTDNLMKILNQLDTLKETQMDLETMKSENAEMDVEVEAMLAEVQKVLTEVQKALKQIKETIRIKKHTKSINRAKVLLVSTYNNLSDDWLEILQEQIQSAEKSGKRADDELLEVAMRLKQERTERKLNKIGRPVLRQDSNPEL